MRQFTGQPPQGSADRELLTLQWREGQDHSEAQLQSQLPKLFLHGSPTTRVLRCSPCVTDNHHKNIIIN